MIRALYTVFAFLSPLFAPWPMAAGLALIGAAKEPWLPLAVGVLLDTLYYARGADSLPLYTLIGLIATIVAYLLRSYLTTRVLR